MTRIEQESTVVTVDRSAFDRDFAFGCVALEYNPERDVVITDNRSRREHRTHMLADITYRCVRCQFDTLDKKLMDSHIATGNHPWHYGPFKNPYGHVADVVIEGIDDYQAFLEGQRSSK